MKYRHILRSFCSTPMALMPSKLEEIVGFLAMKAAGGTLSPAEIAARIGDRRETEAPLALHQIAARGGGSSRGSSIAIIPVFGVINQRMGMMSEISGGTSTQRVSADLRRALADPRVGKVILEVDSPGGSVYGIQELADEIIKARGSKRIIGVANSLAASAAFWIASSCDELVVTPSGEVGSIGVFGIHEDRSAAYAEAGVKFSLVKAGKFKAEGVDFAPLSPEAAGDMQKRVNEYYDQFTRAVAKGRGVSESQVRNGFGEGRVVGAVEAVKLRMADRIATLASTLERFGVKDGGAVSQAGSQRQAFASADDEMRWRRNRARQLGVAV